MKWMHENPIPTRPPPKLLGYRIAAIYSSGDELQCKWLTLEACQLFMRDWHIDKIKEAAQQKTGRPN
jgi:hypothetical protein